MCYLSGAPTLQLGGTMNRSLYYRAVACAAVVIVTVASMNVYAEQPSGKSKELRHEAFLRGGAAISDALRDATTAQPIVSPSLVPPIPPATSLIPPQEEKHRRTMLWIGVGITGAIAIYLIQRSVRNHNSIFRPNQ